MILQVKVGNYVHQCWCVSYASGVDTLLIMGSAVGLIVLFVIILIIFVVSALRRSKRRQVPEIDEIDPDDDGPYTVYSRRLPDDYSLQREIASRYNRRLPDYKPYYMRPAAPFNGHYSRQLPYI